MREIKVLLVNLKAVVYDVKKGTEINWITHSTH